MAVADRYVSVPVTLNDLERGREGSRFSGGSPYLRSYGLTYRAAKCSVVTQVGRSMLLRSPTPPFQGAGPSVPKHYGTSAYAQTVWRGATKFGPITRVTEFSVFLGR